MQPDSRETLHRVNWSRGECYCRSKSDHYIGKELSRTISPLRITTSLLLEDAPKVAFLPKRLRSADILSTSGAARSSLSPNASLLERVFALPAQADRMSALRLYTWASAAAFSRLR